MSDEPFPNPGQPAVKSLHGRARERLGFRPPAERCDTSLVRDRGDEFLADVSFDVSSFLGASRFC